ncbi:IS3 family transposase [Mycoplasmopsis felis]|uniref:IS3 family transposase n=1 Tax=Mycoplasmopsis felis TaxID=33923 RepID=UPI002F90B033
MSKSNNLDLVIQNLEYLTKKKYSNFIIHSDHGFQNTNEVYIDKVKKSNGTVSLSRIGNSLDNREIEILIWNIKTELLNDLDYSEITFDELNLKIKEYVDLYNKERIQSNLEWKTPQQTSMMLEFTKILIFLSIFRLPVIFLYTDIKFTIFHNLNLNLLILIPKLKNILNKII